jgi:tRNA-binding EMAP/Myf-like protein
MLDACMRFEAATWLLFAPLQPAGCTTPGSAIRVEAAQVRGVDSSGMICSAYDLGWAEEPDGAPAFVPKSAPLGSSYPYEPFPVRSGVSQMQQTRNSDLLQHAVCKGAGVVKTVGALM